MKTLLSGMLIIALLLSTFSGCGTSLEEEVPEGQEYAYYADGSKIEADNSKVETETTDDTMSESAKGLMPISDVLTDVTDGMTVNRIMRYNSVTYAPELYTIEASGTAWEFDEGRIMYNRQDDCYRRLL